VDQRAFLVMFIALALAAVFLFLWMRRDRGIVSKDRLPEVLHEPLNGREGPNEATPSV
jgi:hypothetical protein